MNSLFCSTVIVDFRNFDTNLGWSSIFELLPPKSVNLSLISIAFSAYEILFLLTASTLVLKVAYNVENERK
jgi:hypothetical protein